ncbi:MAG: CYTH domain-containing protein [Candidatus Aenigmarchaeota archaeon]|nr:CYTH domain-containing protein [Candidatus Aenigmarchaeota archaeon]
MNNIEAELRSFITKEQYDKLLDFFNKNAELTKRDYQESRYFDCEEDLRIQQSKKYAKLWLKKGRVHDEAREEIEIKVDRKDFDKLEDLLNGIGLNVEIKWFRDRHQFDWKGVKVCIDYTKGYGHILELEKLCSEAEKEKCLEELRERFKELEIEVTPREHFEKKYAHYRKNWKELTK